MVNLQTSSREMDLRTGQPKNGQYTDSFGTRRWFKYGRLHRIDGPAIIRRGGQALWWINDQCYPFEDWLEANTELSNEGKVMMKLKYG